MEGFVRGGEVGAVGEVLKVRGEEFLRDGGVDFHEEGFEFVDDEVSGMVREAAFPGVVSVFAIPVAVVSLFGGGGRVGEGEGEEAGGEEEGEMHCEALFIFLVISVLSVNRYLKRGCKNKKLFREGKCQVI